MVVAFHFEHRRETVADIDDPGIFAGTLEHVRTLGGKLFQVAAGAFVTAVLRPHHGKNAELCVVGLASEDVEDFFVFFSGEAVARDELLSDLGLDEDLCTRVTHGVSLGGYNRQQSTKISSGRLRCREACLSRFPGAASSRRHCGSRCKHRRYSRATRSGSRPRSVYPCYRRNEAGSAGFS